MVTASREIYYFVTAAQLREIYPMNYCPIIIITVTLFLVEYENRLAPLEIDFIL